VFFPLYLLAVQFFRRKDTKHTDTQHCGLFSSICSAEILIRRHDVQYNDIQQKDIHHNDIQHNNTHLNGIQHYNK
jgi:hypothetical protein